MSVLRALLITSEVCGGVVLSDAAAAVMVKRLAEFGDSAVLAALDRCQIEVKHRLTLADIIERIDDGRPGPDEAWAMIPQDEYSSCVMTAGEMDVAWGIAKPLLDGGDRVGARMAFRDAYVRLVNEARAAHRPPRWFPNLGLDKSGRVAALAEAVRRNRITYGHAFELLGDEDARAEFLRMTAAQAPAVSDDQKVVAIATQLAQRLKSS